MKMAKRTTKRPAFTLLEVLVTLSTLVLILGSVYGTYMATTKSLAYSKPKHILQQQARIFLQRIASEIRCCYTTYQDKSPQATLKKNQRRKKKLLKQNDVSFFVGKEISSRQSFLRFVTSAATSRRNHSLGGLAIVEYMLDKSTNTLLRSKRRYVGNSEDDNDNYNWLVVLENIQAIMVEYFDGKKWLEEWDSNDMKGFSPQAVRISLDLQTANGGSLLFTSTAQIACRGQQTGRITVQKTGVRGKDSISDKNSTGTNGSEIIKK